MAKRATRALGATVTVQQVESDPRRVAIAARRAGGVTVVDDRGRAQFKLWMPMQPLNVRG